MTSGLRHSPSAGSAGEDRLGDTPNLYSWKNGPFFVCSYYHFAAYLLQERTPSRRFTMEELALPMGYLGDTTHDTALFLAQRKGYTFLENPGSNLRLFFNERY
jgi:hypothetical protein